MRSTTSQQVRRLEAVERFYLDNDDKLVKYIDLVIYKGLTSKKLRLLNFKSDEYNPDTIEQISLAVQDINDAIASPNYKSKSTEDFFRM